MTHASLFTGIGGFDLSASWMGWQNLFTCEIDPFCNTILEYYFQNSKHYEDIKKTDFTEWRGKVDVLTGGFPCQPFSIAGKRNGKTDDRYLWPEMLRAIRYIRPAWVVGENVDGIISMVQPGCELEVEHQSAMFEEDFMETILEQEYVVETICRDLECEGYSVQPVVIPACAVGAPHRRNRVWFIAHRNSHDSGRCGYGEIGRASGKDKEIEKQRKRVWNESERTCKERIVANSYKLNMHVSGFSSGEISQFETSGIWKNSIEHSNGERCEEQHIVPFTDETPGFGSIGHIEDWENWPTQSPIYSGDDGFSDRLDGITFSKWRNESIKAYGNAIVPQVAFEIFKAIEKINNF